jgi:predicted component of type VI protein secretion system
LITCVECGAQHYPGTLFCDACGAAIHPAARAYLDAIAPRSRQATSPANKVAQLIREPQPVAIPPPLPAAKPKARPLRVTIPSQGAELVLQAELIQVGRADPDTESAPELDLTPYHGLEKGVSRRHAAIQWVADGYVILDQHSINGTWLDGIRLVPGYAYQIPPGAEILFGELLVQISLAD